MKCLNHMRSIARICSDLPVFRKYRNNRKIFAIIQPRVEFVKPSSLHTAWRVVCQALALRKCLARRTSRDRPTDEFGPCVCFEHPNRAESTGTHAQVNFITVNAQTISRSTHGRRGLWKPGCVADHRPCLADLFG